MKTWALTVVSSQKMRAVFLLLLIFICVGDSSKDDATVTIAIAVSVPLFVINVIVVVVVVVEVLICRRRRVRGSAVPQTNQFVDGLTQSRTGAGYLPLNVREEIPSQYPMVIGQPRPHVPLGPQPGGVYSPPFGDANMDQSPPVIETFI